MRTFSSQKQTLFQSGLYSTHLKVTVGSQDMTSLEGLNWVVSADISNTISQSVATARAVFVRRFAGLSLATLMDGSKLNASGTLLDAAKAIEIHAAITPPSMTPESADWMSVFKGYVDTVDWSGSTISVDCRDLGGRLEDTFIEVQRVYGSAGGVAVETVMQSILTDNSTGVTLYSITGDAGTPFKPADSPGWMLRPYKQSKVSVLAALRQLAQQIGWEVKYRYNSNVSNWVLTLYDPLRELRARGTLTLTGQPTASETFVVNSTTFTAKASGAGTDEFNIGSTVQGTCDNIVAMLNAGSEAANIEAWRYAQTVVIEWGIAGTVGNGKVFTESLTNATADGSGYLGGTLAGRNVPASSYTLASSDYNQLTRMAVSARDVRNVVKTVISNADDGMIRYAVIKEHATSIAKYGRKYMELALGSTDQINNLKEAHSLCGAVIEDLREPDALIDVDVIGPFIWAELCDTLAIEANGEHFDTTQELAVNSISLRFTMAAVSTALSMCGRPNGGNQRWFECEGGRGAGAPVDEYDDAAATGATATPAIGMIIVEYDDPRTMEPAIDDWAYTECHVSTSSGFTPSSSTLVARGKQTRFEVGGLIPGTTYYAKLVIVDDLGNIAATTAQVSVATQKVAAYHTNNATAFMNLAINGDFGQNTFPITDLPPDAWNTQTGEWYSTLFPDTTVTESGDRSIRWDSRVTSYSIYSDLIPVGNEVFYKASAVVRADSTGAGVAAILGVTLYDSSKTYIGFMSQTHLFVSADTWESVDLYFYGHASPTPAKWASVFVIPYAAGFDMWCDAIRMTYGMQSFKAYTTYSQSIPTATARAVEYNTEVYDEGGYISGGSTYGFLTNGRYVVYTPGYYSFQGGVELLSLADGTEMEVGFMVNGAVVSTGTRSAIGAAGHAFMSSSFSSSLVRGDYVQVYVKHNYGSNRTVGVGTTNTWFTGGRLF